jgi:UDP-2,3-diacylglucosamine pyrophosphatase LpxH
LRLNTVRIPYLQGDTFTLWPLGDVHLGSRSCDVDLFERVIKRIRDDDRALWGGMGDYCEWIARDDPRWASGEIDERIVNLASLDRIGDVYVEKIASMLKPIARKCAWMGFGNHEHQFQRRHHTDLTARILRALELPDDHYGGWMGKTRLVFEDGSNHRNAVVVYHAHGWQAGRKEGAKLNNMRELPGFTRADIYLHGHSHSRFADALDWLDENQSFTKPVSKRAYVSHTGSFVKTYELGQSSYAEQKAYLPTSLGPPRFLITPKTDGPAHIEAIA